jgi:hypothetical protein
VPVARAIGEARDLTRRGCDANTTDEIEAADHGIGAVDAVRQAIAQYHASRNAWASPSVSGSWQAP